MCYILFFYLFHKTTYYNVSGGPMMRTSHLYMSLSSINPAEKPSTGFLFSSEKKNSESSGRAHFYTSRVC